LSPNFRHVRRLSNSSHRDDGALRHLNRCTDGVFEIVRVVGCGLVSIAEVHAMALGITVPNAMQLIADEVIE
jgi:hypothetical protein